MKTLLELNALIPSIIKLLSKKNHEVGDNEFDESIENEIFYGEDGWEIRIVYSCTGEYDIDEGDDWTPGICNLVRAWGEIDEISAYHYDEETDEETEFSEEDLSDLFYAVNEYLEELI